MEEKIWKLQKGYRNVSDQTDVMIPADARYVKGFDENGYAVYRWPKYLGFVRNSIRSITRENGLPDMMDRYGRNTGSNFAAVPAGGKYAYDLRAIPYVENEKSYHKFMVKYKENYCDKIDAIRGGDFKKLNEIISGEGKEPITEKEFLTITRDYSEKILDLKSADGIIEDVTYGMKGIVAKYNSTTPELPGGAEQYTLPLSAESLIKIKVLEK